MRLREAGLACCHEPLIPGRRNGRELIVPELAEGTSVARRVDDHLLVLERRVEIRHDAHLPAGCIRFASRRCHSEGLGWRAVLAPLAERALLELFGGGRLELACFRSGPARSRGSDDDGSA